MKRTKAGAIQKTLRAVDAKIQAKLDKEIVGNPVGGASEYRDVVIMPAEVLACTDADAQPIGDYWDYTQIARAFYKYAGPAYWSWPAGAPTQADCVAALTIVAGECNPGVTPSKGCSASATGPSGAFQTDFLRTLVGYPQGQAVMPLCTSAWGAGFMAAPFFKNEARAGVNQVAMPGGEASPSSIFTCKGAVANLNDAPGWASNPNCRDPAANINTTYSN